jgi:hypothetical protein
VVRLARAFTRCIIDMFGVGVYVLGFILRTEVWNALGLALKRNWISLVCPASGQLGVVMYNRL